MTDSTEGAMDIVTFTVGAAANNQGLLTTLLAAWLPTRRTQAMVVRVSAGGLQSGASNTFSQCFRNRRVGDTDRQAAAFAHSGDVYIFVQVDPPIWLLSSIRRRLQRS